MVTMYPVAPVTGFHESVGLSNGSSRVVVVLYNTVPSAGEIRTGCDGGTTPAMLST